MNTSASASAINNTPEWAEDFEIAVAEALAEAAAEAKAEAKAAAEVPVFQYGTIRTPVGNGVDVEVRPYGVSWLVSGRYTGQKGDTLVLTNGTEYTIPDTGVVNVKIDSYWVKGKLIAR